MEMGELASRPFAAKQSLAVEQGEALVDRPALTIATDLQRPRPGVVPARRVASTGGMRRAIARRVLLSKQTIPHFYLKFSIDAGALTALHEETKLKFKTSLNDLLVKACGVAVQAFPAFGSRMEGDELSVRPRADIGVAVGTEDGLLIPTVLDAGELSLKQLAAETRRIVAAARSGKIVNAGKGVFTVTNLGMFGIEEFYGIINPPESAILADAVKPGPPGFAMRPTVADIIRPGKTEARQAIFHRRWAPLRPSGDAGTRPAASQR